MTPDKRGRDTACAVPDSRGLHDTHCERIVLAGLLKEPKETLRHLRELRFATGDMYQDTHQRVYDVLVFVATGGTDGPILADVYDEVRKRGNWLDTFATGAAFTDWLIDVWCTDLWFADIVLWANVGREFNRVPFPTWAAHAAAYKVKHLTTRRYAIHAANEVIRDAMDPVDGVQGLGDRITKFDEEF